MFVVPSFFGFQDAGKFIGLLDEYPGAAAAYSVRRLSGAYTGSLLQVRRSSNNDVLDIGFDSNGDLDTAALTSFCSGTDGFVTEWYDQSGNGINATQGTAINQPQIVSSGSVLTLTGVGSARPIMLFDGVNDFFSFTPITLDQFTSFYPSKKQTSATISAWMSKNGSLGNPYTPVVFKTFGAYIQNQGNNQYSLSGYNNTNYILISGGFSGTVGSIQVNNSNIALTLNPTPSVGTEIDVINTRAAGEFSNASVPEMILYDFDNSANLSAINTNINTYYGIY